MKTQTRQRKAIRSSLLQCLSTAAATALLALAPGASLHAYTPRDGETINLKTFRGQYVTARGTTLTGAAAGDGPAQRFEVSVAGNGRILLRNGQSYVSVDGQGLLRSGASRQNATPLRVLTLDGNDIALETQNGRFVRAGIGELCQLGALSEHIRSWERFSVGKIADPGAFPVLPFPPSFPPSSPPLPPVGDNGNACPPSGRESERKVSFRTGNGTYLRAGVGAQGALAASGEQARMWQQFTLKPDAGNTVQIMDGMGRMLKATEDGRVLAVAGPGLLIRRDAHRFEVLELANGNVAIKTAFGKYIAVQDSGAAVASDARVSARSSFRLGRILAVAQR